LQHRHSRTCSLFLANSQTSLLLSTDGPGTSICLYPSDRIVTRFPYSPVFRSGLQHRPSLPKVRMYGSLSFPTLRLCGFARDAPFQQYGFPRPQSEIINRKSKIPNPQSEIRNPKSEIINRKSSIENPKSPIHNPQSPIINPQSYVSSLHTAPFPIGRTKPHRPVTGPAR